MPKKKTIDDRKVMSNTGEIFTIGELKKFLAEEKIKPSDLFDDYSLQEDSKIKKMIAERAEFELEYRDRESQREVDKMEKEKEEIEEKEGKNFDLLPGDAPPSRSEKEREKKGESEEDKQEGDLLPPSDSDESSESEGDQKDEEPLLPG